MKASYHQFDSSAKLHKRPFFTEVTADIEESRVLGTAHTVFAKYLPQDFQQHDYVLLEMSQNEAKALGEQLISASADVDADMSLEVKS